MGGVDNFEWDDDKAIRNLAKHSIKFEEATKVFDDLLSMQEIDDGEDYGEERFAIVGIVGNRLLKVIYTERGKHIRTISARKATKHEWKDYNR